MYRTEIRTLFKPSCNTLPDMWQYLTSKGTCVYIDKYIMSADNAFEEYDFQLIANVHA